MLLTSSGATKQQKHLSYVITSVMIEYFFVKNSAFLIKKKLELGTSHLVKKETVAFF